MNNLLAKVPVITKIISAVLIVLFFVPLVSVFGVSISSLNLLLGLKTMGMTVMEGSLGMIFVLLTPLAILIASFLSLNQKTLITVGLSVVGLIVTGVLGGAVNDVTGSGSFVVVLFAIGYIALLILNGLLLFMANPAGSAEAVQRGIGSAMHVVSNVADKAKTAVGGSDVKKATSVADQLKTYKDLLDQGIITQAEFDKKKGEILSASQQR
jgi:hypothetical protein